MNFEHVIENNSKTLNIKKHRLCIFCRTPLSGKEKSKEHIFPKWLQKHLRIEKTHLYQTLFRTNGGTENNRKYTFNKHVSGLVCRDCNNGWMNRLEGKAKPLLIPLLNGDRGHIEQEQCEIIAKWLYKTSLTLHSASIKEKIIPIGHYKYLYEKNQIPRGVFIAIAPINVIKEKDDLYWIENGDWTRVTKEAPTEIIKNYLKNAYKISMRAGKLSWRIIYLPRENRPAINFFEFPNDCVKYIHPCKEKKINWNTKIAFEKLGELDSSLMYR